MGKVNAKIDLTKHIWEGWTVQDFINGLEWQIEMIMTNQSWKKPFKTRKEVADYCKDYQPYYKKEIPDVVNYFCNKYNIE